MDPYFPKAPVGKGKNTPTTFLEDDNELEFTRQEISMLRKSINSLAKTMGNTAKAGGRLVGDTAKSVGEEAQNLRPKNVGGMVAGQINPLLGYIAAQMFDTPAYAKIKEAAGNKIKGFAGAPFKKLEQRRMEREKLESEWWDKSLALQENTNELLSDLSGVETEKTKRTGKVKREASPTTKAVKASRQITPTVQAAQLNKKYGSQKVAISNKALSLKRVSDIRTKVQSEDEWKTAVLGELIKIRLRGKPVEEPPLLKGRKELGTTGGKRTVGYDTGIRVSQTQEFGTIGRALRGFFSAGGEDVESIADYGARSAEYLRLINKKLGDQPATMADRISHSFDLIIARNPALRAASRAAQWTGKLLGKLNEKKPPTIVTVGARYKKELKDTGSPLGNIANNTSMIYVALRSFMDSSAGWWNKQLKGKGPGPTWGGGPTTEDVEYETNKAKKKKMEDLVPKSLIKMWDDAKEVWNTKVKGTKTGNQIYGVGGSAGLAYNVATMTAKQKADELKDKIVDRFGLQGVDATTVGKDIKSKYKETKSKSESTISSASIGATGLIEEGKRKGKKLIEDSAFKAGIVSGVIMNEASAKGQKIIEKKAEAHGIMMGAVAKGQKKYQEATEKLRGNTDKNLIDQAQESVNKTSDKAKQKAKGLSAYFKKKFEVLEDLDNVERAKVITKTLLMDVPMMMLGASAKFFFVKLPGFLMKMTFQGLMMQAKFMLQIPKWLATHGLTKFTVDKALRLLSGPIKAVIRFSEQFLTVLVKDVLKPMTGTILKVSEELIKLPKRVWNLTKKLPYYFTTGLANLLEFPFKLAKKTQDSIKEHGGFWNAVWKETTGAFTGWWGRQTKWVKTTKARWSKKISSMLGTVTPADILEKKSLSDLRELAKQYHIRGAGKMDQKQLAVAINKAQEKASKGGFFGMLRKFKENIVNFYKKDSEKDSELAEKQAQALKRLKDAWEKTKKLSAVWNWGREKFGKAKEFLFGKKENPVGAQVGDLPKYAEGTKGRAIKETGPAILHKGEVVDTADAVSKRAKNESKMTRYLRSILDITEEQWKKTKIFQREEIKANKAEEQHRRWERMKGMFEQIIGFIGPVLSAVIAPITGALSSIGTAIMGAIGLKGGIKGLGGMLGGKIAGTGIGKKVLGMGKFAKGAGILSVASAGMDAIEGFKRGGLAGGIGSFLGGNESGAEGATSGALKGAGMGAAIGSIVPGVGTAIGGAIGAIAGGILGFIGGENIESGLKWVWDKTKSIVSTVGDFIMYPFKLIGEGIDRAKVAISSAWDSAKDSISSAVDIVGSLINPIIEPIKGIFSSISDAASSLWESAKNMGTLIKDGIIEGIASLISALPIPGIKWVAEKIRGMKSGPSLSALEDTAGLEKMKADTQTKQLEISKSRAAGGLDPASQRTYTRMANDSDSSIRLEAENYKQTKGESPIQVASLNPMTTQPNISQSDMAISPVTNYPVKEVKKIEQEEYEIRGGVPLVNEASRKTFDNNYKEYIRQGQDNIGATFLAGRDVAKLIQTDPESLKKSVEVLQKGGYKPAQIAARLGIPTKLATDITAQIKEQTSEAEGSQGPSALKAGFWSVMKKLPVVGALVGAGLGVKRAFQGDFKGAAMEVSSGLMSQVPGAGQIASAGVDVALYKRDKDRAKQMAENKKTAQAQSITPIEGEDDIKDMIKRHEGFRDSAYRDATGYSIGYGHFIKPNEQYLLQQKISQSQGDDLFESDYAYHKRAAEKIPGYSNLSYVGQGALTDMTYNMGPEWYKSWPNFTKSLQEGKIQEAANSILGTKYARDVGPRANEIAALIATSKAVSTSPEEKAKLESSLASAQSPKISEVGPAVTGENAKLAQKEISPPIKPAEATPTIPMDAAKERAAEGPILQAKQQSELANEQIDATKEAGKGVEKTTAQSAVMVSSTTINKSGGNTSVQGGTNNSFASGTDMTPNMISKILKGDGLV